MKQIIRNAADSIACSDFAMKLRYGRTGNYVSSGITTGQSVAALASILGLACVFVVF